MEGKTAYFRPGKTSGVEQGQDSAPLSGSAAMCLRRMTPAGISRGGEPDGSIRIAAGEGRADSLPQFRVGEHVVAGHGPWARAARSMPLKPHSELLASAKAGVCPTRCAPPMEI